jgi:hypothetical protein
LFDSLFAYSRLVIFPSYLANVTITGNRAVTLDLYVALMAFSSECSFFVSTLTGTQILGLYGLLQRTDTHVPPNLCASAPITAARGRPYCLKINTIQFKTNTIQFIRQGTNSDQFNRNELFVYNQNWQCFSFLLNYTIQAIVFLSCSMHYKTRSKVASTCLERK